MIALNEQLDLLVYICSDGTIMAYNKDGTINTLYTDTICYRTLKRIYKASKLDNSDRKSTHKELQVKHIKYYFRNTLTGENMEIPESHIPNIISCIR